MIHGRLIRSGNILFGHSTLNTFSSLNENKLIGQDQAKSILVNNKICVLCSLAQSGPFHDEEPFTFMKILHIFKDASKHNTSC